MQSLHWLGETTQYILEAIARIWSNQDQYPAVGMFAFHGEIPVATFSDWPEPLTCPLACLIK